MSTPSPFHVARETSNNLSKAYTQAKDENAIDSILAQAMQTGRPEVLQDSIGKILSQVSQERQGPAIQFLQSKVVQLQNKQKEERQRNASLNVGINPDLPESIQKLQFENQGNDKRLQNILGTQSPNQNQSTPNIGSDPNIPNPSQQQPFQYKDLSDEQLIQLRQVKGFEKSSDSELNRRAEERKAKKPGDEFNSLREKSIHEYVNNALSQREDAENLKFTIATARKAIQGDVAGPGLNAIAKNNPYTQLLVGLTPDEASLQAANKKLLEGSKGIFGSKPTEREIFLLLNSMLPSIGKTKEANEAGLDFIEKINDMKLLHSEMVDRLTEGGIKYVPDLERQVNALVKPFADKLRSDLEVAVEKYGNQEKKTNSESNTIRVRAPDGTKYEMTQEQIDNAKDEGVYFEPIK